VKEERYGARVGGAILAGGLVGTAGAAAVGFILGALRHQPGLTGASDAYRHFLAAGGWLWISLWCVALSLLLALRWAPSLARKISTAALALGIGVLPLVARPRVNEPEPKSPRTAAAKRRAILKWSFASPQTVARILPLSRDPDPEVREQAVLALGVNLIVTDIEQTTVTRPSRYSDHPLRESLRARLLEAMAGDPSEAVRVEAARALWKAPVAFGTHPAAAETLSAVLDRALRPGTPERVAWLALDAAAGPADSSLILAARRFEAATPDPELRRAARIAAREMTP
jgi:hypothetical protein